jgi:hypothetical protein
MSYITILFSPISWLNCIIGCFLLDMKFIPALGSSHFLEPRTSAGHQGYIYIYIYLFTLDWWLSKINELGWRTYPKVVGYFAILSWELLVLWKFEPKIQRFRKFSKNYKRRFLDFSKLEKLELEVLNKIKEPPNTGFLFIYSRKTGFLECLVLQ